MIWKIIFLPKHKKGPPADAGGSLSYCAKLVGSGVGIGVVAPEHVLAQLGAHGLHLMLGQLGTLGVEEGAAVLVLGDPLAGEHAVLDVGEDSLHVLLGLLIGQDTGTGDILAVLGGVGDGVVHHGDRKSVV